jgi:NADH:ubiquinone oxidoreductase subunit F (NADH-binding)
MILGGYVTGAGRGIIFLRHEYQAPQRALERALADAREHGVVGPDAFGSGRGFEVDLFLSPGGYICGEETALLEALEGKRAEPRNKPPFPGTHGLFQKPTLINNVETFAWVPAILRRGAAWWKSQGRSGASGLKYLALSGDVEQPGVYEVPLGLPAGELIQNYGGGVSAGRRLKAFAPGGASSGFLPARQSDIALDFKALAQAGSMLGSGAVVAVAEGRCMLDLALNLVRFFRNESCGKCVPCRTGSAKLVEILERARRGRGEPADFERIEALAQVMGDTSICGLGQVAAWPLTSVLKHFPDELRAHFLERRCPEKVCAL